MYKSEEADLVKIREDIGITFVIQEPDHEIEEYRTVYIGPRFRHPVHGKPESANLVDHFITGDRLRALQRCGFLPDYHSKYMHLYRTYTENLTNETNPHSSNGP